MTVAQLLRRKESWTQGVYARNAAGEKVRFDDPAATSWCLWGALKKCYPDHEQYVKAYERLRFQLNPLLTPAEWADAPERTHAEVLEFVKACRI